MTVARAKDTIRRRFAAAPRSARVARRGRLRLQIDGRTVRLDVPTVDLGEIVIHPTVASLGSRSAQLDTTVSATARAAGVPFDAVWPDVDTARARILAADELIGRPPFGQLDVSGDLPRWPDEHREQAAAWFEVASAADNPARFSGKWQSADGTKYKETQVSKGEERPIRLKVDESTIADFETDEKRQIQAWKASDEELRSEVPRDASDGFSGDPAALYVADARGRPLEQNATYRVVSAERLVPSHDPETFRPHPDYPAGVQERAYHRDKAEQQKVRSHAQHIVPELLINTSPDASNGPPIVMAGQVVLGGNSRAMSLQLAYRSGKADAYRDLLLRECRDYGLTPRQVAAVPQPVLVRQVESDEQPQILVRRYNEAFTQALDPRAEQVARARLVNERVLDALGRGLDERTRDGEPRWPTLNAYLSDARAARPFVDALKASGVIDERNTNAYIDQETGGLNTDGRLFAERLLVGHLVPDADLLGRITLSRLQTISRAVPHIVRARSHGHDASGALAEALAADAYMRRHDLKTLAELDRDQELALGLIQGRKPELDAAGRAMLRLLLDRPGPVQFAAAMRDLAADAERSPAGQADLLGGERTLAELLERRVAGETSSAQQSLLSSPGALPPRPPMEIEAPRRTATSPPTPAPGPPLPPTPPEPPTELEPPQPPSAVQEPPTELETPPPPPAVQEPPTELETPPPTSAVQEPPWSAASGATDIGPKQQLRDDLLAAVTDLDGRLKGRPFMDPVRLKVVDDPLPDPDWIRSSYAEQDELARQLQRVRELIAEDQANGPLEKTREPFDGGYILDNDEIDRVQVVFAAKPPAELRDRLKAARFRWAPKQHAWQRPRSVESIELARQLVGIDPDVRENNPPAAFPVSALPAWMGSWASAEAEAVQVPIELPGLFALAVSAAALGGKVRIEPRPGWVEPLNLFVCVALPPGERKSAVVRHALQPLLEHEQSAGDGAAPVYCDDATPAALARQMAQAGGRMAVLSAEGGVFEQMLASGRSGLDVYLKGHAGDVLRTDRITREGLTIEAPALTVAVTTQPHVLERLGSKIDLSGRGLLARFLWAAPPAQRGARDFEAAPMPRHIGSAYTTRLKRLCELGDAPRPIRIVPAGVALLGELHARIEPQLGRGGRLEWMADWAAKMVGAVCRIAGLIAVCEASRLDVEVSEDQVGRAIRIAEWALGEAERVLGDTMQLREGGR